MALQWNILTSVAEVEQIIQLSQRVPCLIMKHSTRCSISSIAKLRLEDDWHFTDEELVPWYLDLIAYREVSNYLADHFSVHHESPQVLLLKDGECMYDASHLDISVEELEEVMA
jgi:bacillithiol system protein YtxJ